jgi:hypothetical protein
MITVIEGISEIYVLGKPKMYSKNNEFQRFGFSSVFPTHILFL